MKSKTTREKLVKIYETLSVLNEVKGFKFNYAIAQNKKRIEDEVKVLREMSKVSDEYAKYDAEAMELKKKWAEKDEKGNPVIVTQNNLQFFDIQKREEFNKELEELNKKHKEAIKKREEGLKEFEAFVKEEFEFDFYEVNKDDVPEDLTGTQTELVLNFIKE